MARETPVFISYARADERYATELMSRLAKEPDIAPWQDRIRMSPGDFEDQIKAGIDSSDYLVLVMTPAALRSPWVELECRYAREKGRCIVPIQPKFESNAMQQELEDLRGQLPVWMQKIQTYDFDKYWKRFVAVLQSPCQATRAPFLAASLPSSFVPRPGVFRQIVDSMLDERHKNPSGKTIVLHGTGGFGKTTLALSVCHDPDTLAAFDGGVLWVTLGEQPQVVAELERMYTALTGERPGFKGKDDAMFEVAKKLDGKRCLIVIDDVWSFQDLKPFLHGASSSSRLVTSRIFNVAVSAASDQTCRINVVEPEEDEADRILSAGLSVPDASAGHVRMLARRLKRVPLLLQLGNRTLVQQCALGQSVEEALHWALQQYKDLGVVAFDEKSSRERSDAVGNTIEVSLGFLADERQRCVELGVLHEDTEVPFSVLGALWKRNERQVQLLAQRLNDFALVKLSLKSRSIRLHDYIREYLESILPDRARVHGRLIDAWKGGKQVPAGYAVQHVVFHLVECLSEPAEVVPRATQLIELLCDEKFQEYQQEHGDATELVRKIELAIRRVGRSTAPEVPALMAALVLLRKSQSSEARNAALIFEAAAKGEISEALQLLALFEAERRWDTLARLLIAWVSPVEKANEAKALAAEAAESCDSPTLQRALAWVRHAPKIPAGLKEASGGPELGYVSAILQRAGGAEKLEGLEPLTYEDLASGTDATGFIAERDGPDLVAFARQNPQANTQYLEQYIEIHAANRYAHYRNRSLWMLLPPILERPDARWVRGLVQRIVTGALTAAAVDFEEALPIAVLGTRARRGDVSAVAALEDARGRLFHDAATLRPHEGRTDSWSHHHRRASALAETFAVALDRGTEAADLLSFARNLPKGFAGFRALSAVTLAESMRIASPKDRASREAALTSARAASHRIQDPRFCLQVTAMVNTMTSRWLEIPAREVEAVVDRFLENPLQDEFCAVHRVLEGFEYRAQDQQAFQALPIPESVRNADTLRKIARVFDCALDDIVKVNGWVWGDPDTRLVKDSEVNVPDPEFAPILAARFAAEALAADGLPAETRSGILQRLAPMALPNPTAFDTVLARLMLSTLERPAMLPPLLRNLGIPSSAGDSSSSESTFA
jgi:hypothetical protein